MERLYITSWSSKVEEDLGLGKVVFGSVWFFEGRLMGAFLLLGTGDGFGKRVWVGFGSVKCYVSFQRDS